MKKLLSAIFIGASFFLTHSSVLAQCTLVGWASQNGGVTGGGNATPVVVSNYTDLKNAITTSTVKVIHISGTITIPSAGRISFQDQSGKTIYGLPGSRLVSNDLTKDGSGILYVKRCSNVIFRNVTFEGPGAYDTDGWDNITIDNSTNIWVDHCEFQDGMDGNLDIKNAADYITVTWCKFIYNKAPIPGGSGGSNDHRFSNLFGSSDGATGDRGKLRVTMQYNWWAQGCKERMPRVRFGKVHMVNNLFNSTVSNKCIMAGFEADLLVESNVFENVNSPIDKMDNNFTAITARDNIFTNVSGNTTGSGTAFTPPYTLSVTPAATVKTLVTAGAGATLSSFNCDGNSVTYYSLSATATPATGGTVSGGGAYADGTTATLTATPAQGYTFVSWSGDATGTNTTTTVTMNSNKSVTANFQQVSTNTYTLSTVITPSGAGSITVSPQANSYAEGTAVTLSAVPAAGYVFTGWSGDAAGTNSSVTITMNSNKNVVANFDVYTSGGSATIRIEDDATTATGLCVYDGAISNNSGANNGKVINLSNSSGKAVEWSVFAPVAGTYSVNWRYVNSSSSNAYSMRLLVNGVVIDEACPFPKTSSSTVFSNTFKTVALSAGNNKIRLETTTSSATADIDWMEVSGEAPVASDCSGTTVTSYTVSTTASPASGGTVTGAGTYTSGSVVSLTATATSGYTFTGWSGDATGTTATVSITVNSNKTVTANFAPITYTVSTTASPASGGTVTGAGTYTSGSVVSLTATATSGYTFTGWSGDATGTASTVSITVNSNKTVTANFAPITYTVSTTASPASGGTVTGAGTYTSGSVVSLTATAASGYTFTGWSGDATGTTATVSITVNSNKTVTANFAPITYTVSTTASPASGGTVTGAGTYTSGSVVSLTATAASGYTFTGWSGDATGTASTVSITVNSNKNVTANFQQQSGGTSSTIRIEDSATPSTGFCSYEGTISSNSGASNGKVINLTNSTAKGANWKVNVPAAGTYTLTWRYVNSSSNNAYTMALIINGVTVNSAQAFPKTSSSTVFANSMATVSLNAGANTIRLQSVSSTATADIDWIEITGNAPSAGNCAAARMAVNSTATDELYGQKSMLYPNPARDVVRLQVTVEKNEQLFVRIYDAKGVLVDNLGATKAGVTGKQQLLYSVHGKRAGLYTVLFTSSKGHTFTQKLVIQ